MRLVLVLLLFVLPPTLEPERHSLDLEPLLQDPEALQRLTVVYLDGIVHKGASFTRDGLIDFSFAAMAH
jgi:hypothetical protein